MIVYPRMYYDPSRRSSKSLKGVEEMGFLQSIYSYVFGDGEESQEAMRREEAGFVATGSSLPHCSSLKAGVKGREEGREQGRRLDGWINRWMGGRKEGCMYCLARLLSPAQPSHVTAQPQPRSPAQPQARPSSVEPSRA